ncbi:MAG: hypothetical protein N2506_02795 [Dehalococcoidales bacterium]|nr:hypothetical protein [Dehalococcoidales bacterium]
MVDHSAGPRWQVTATTVYCEHVDDEVTFIVRPDGACRCTGQDRYFTPDGEVSRRMKQRSKSLGRVLRCLGEGCPLLLEHRDEILKI